MNENLDSSTAESGQPDGHQPSGSAPNSQAPSSQASNSRTVVRLILLGVLVVLVLALAYDYLVARPAVDNAFDQISALNDEINSSAGAQVLTSADVQQTLGRGPNDVEQEGTYTTEVYRWRAGLPWRTYDYYVVYFSGPNLRFATHFKHEKPPMSSFAPSVDWKPGEDMVPGGGEGPEPEESPAEESPAEESPAEESPAEESPAGESPAEESPTGESPAEESAAEESPAGDAPADGQGDDTT